MNLLTKRIELEMLKYLNRKKYVPMWRLKMNFPICFNKIASNLIAQNLITREHLEGEPLFIPKTLIPLGGSGRFTITTFGKEYLDNLKKGRYSSAQECIKKILGLILAVIIECAITYLIQILPQYFHLNTYT